MTGKTLLLDSSGDLVFSPLKRFEYVAGDEKIAQDVWVILKTIKGSDKFNPDMGVDYFKIIESGYNRKLIEGEIRKALSRYPNVKEVEEIEIFPPDSNRVVTVYLRVRIATGETLSLEVQL
jgi:phage baseplate assembly protein W